MSSLPGLVLIVHLFGLVEGGAAFVLHDTFAVPFDQIAPIVGRSPAATRQLASGARRRCRGASTVAAAGLTHTPIDGFTDAFTVFAVVAAVAAAGHRYSREPLRRLRVHERLSTGKV